MTDLNDYLQSPEKEYAEGVRLYEKYAGNDKFLAFFRQDLKAEPGSMQFNMLIQRLKNKLRVLSSMAPEAIVVNEVNARSTPIKIQKLALRKPDAAEMKLDPDSMPEDIRQLYKINQDLHIQIAGAHAAVKSSKTDEERKFNLSNAVEWQEQKDRNWSRINDWLKETGKTTSAEKTPEVNKEKRIATLQRNIRRIEKELREKTAGVKAEKLKKKKQNLMSWKKELKDLE